MRRVCVVGNSGSGKTTLARVLAARLGVPHLELDSVFHQPGWTEPDPEDFTARVAAFTAGEGWVLDGNYSRVRDLVWRRADTIVWLDLPRMVVMRRVLRRTSSRVLRRTELWQGNRETLRNVLSRDPARSIIAWSWTSHARYRAMYEELSRDPEWSHVRWVRLRRLCEVAEWVAGIQPE